MTNEQIEEFLLRLKDLSHGGTSGPMGMEAIVMALCGKDGPGEDSVSAALRDVACAIRELAIAISDHK
jgi:hypothetical protein